MVGNICGLRFVVAIEVETLKRHPVPILSLDPSFAANRSERNLEILPNAQIAEHAIGLECESDTLSHPMRWKHPGDVLSVEKDAAAVECKNVAEESEEGRFASAVGANNALQVAACDVESDIVSRDAAAEMLLQPFNRQNGALFHACDDLRRPTVEASDGAARRLARSARVTTSPLGKNNIPMTSNEPMMTRAYWLPDEESR